MGAVFLRNYDVIYDTENRALSFVRARCDNSTLFGSFEKANRMLVSLGGAGAGSEPAHSVLSRVRSSVKHLFGGVAVKKGGSSHKIERFSNKHYKESLKTEFFKEHTMVVNIYAVFGLFLLGGLIFTIFFCSESCKKKEGYDEKGNKYNELVDQEPQN